MHRVELFFFGNQEHLLKFAAKLAASNHMENINVN